MLEKVLHVEIINSKWIKFIKGNKKTVCNVTFDSIVSDMFGKSASKMILTAIYHMLTLGETFESSDLKPDINLQGKEKKRLESIKQAVNY